LEVTRSVWFSPWARSELEEAIAWHEYQQSGSGAELEAALNSTLEASAQRPERFPKISPGIRRASSKKFPFCTCYFADYPGHLDVIAVYHSKRGPQGFASG